MEFDDPIHAKREKHAAQFGSYPELDPAGHAALLNEDDRQRQLTTFMSKFSDAREPPLWGPAFMQICNTIAVIHMTDMSAQTNMLILDHDPEKKDVVYVQLEDVTKAAQGETKLAILPPKQTSANKPVKQETAMDTSNAAAQQQQPPAVFAGDMLKARRAQLIRNMR